MADIDVKASSWKLVEVGRVVTFLRGTYAGRLAAIVEIVDHKRVRFETSSSQFRRLTLLGSRRRAIRICPRSSSLLSALQPGSHPDHPQKSTSRNRKWAFVKGLEEGGGGL